MEIDTDIHVDSNVSSASDSKQQGLLGYYKVLGFDEKSPAVVANRELQQVSERLRNAIGNRKELEVQFEAQKDHHRRLTRIVDNAKKFVSLSERTKNESGKDKKSEQKLAKLRRMEKSLQEEQQKLLADIRKDQEQREKREKQRELEFDLAVKLRGRDGTKMAQQMQQLILDQQKSVPVEKPEQEKEKDDGDKRPEDKKDRKRKDKKDKRDKPASVEGGSSPVQPSRKADVVRLADDDEVTVLERHMKQVANELSLMREREAALFQQEDDDFRQMWEDADFSSSRLYQRIEDDQAPMEYQFNFGDDVTDSLGLGWANRPNPLGLFSSNRLSPSRPDTADPLTRLIAITTLPSGQMVSTDLPVEEGIIEELARVTQHLMKNRALADKCKDEIDGDEKRASELRAQISNDVKSTYKKLARVHHPDHNEGTQASTSNFQEIAAAYNVLVDSKLRAEYDSFNDHAKYIEQKTKERLAQEEQLRPKIKKPAERAREEELKDESEPITPAKRQDVLRIGCGGPSRPPCPTARVDKGADASTKDRQQRVIVIEWDQRCSSRNSQYYVLEMKRGRVGSNWETVYQGHDMMCRVSVEAKSDADFIFRVCGVNSVGRGEFSMESEVFVKRCRTAAERKKNRLQKQNKARAQAARLAREQLLAAIKAGQEDNAGALEKAALDRALLAFAAHDTQYDDAVELEELGVFVLAKLLAHEQDELLVVGWKNRVAQWVSTPFHERNAGLADEAACSDAIRQFAAVLRSRAELDTSSVPHTVKNMLFQAVAKLTRKLSMYFSQTQSVGLHEAVAQVLQAAIVRSDCFSAKQIDDISDTLLKLQAQKRQAELAIKAKEDEAKRRADELARRMKQDEDRRAAEAAAAERRAAADRERRLKEERRRQEAEAARQREKAAKEAEEQQQRAAQEKAQQKRVQEAREKLAAEERAWLARQQAAEEQERARAAQQQQQQKLQQATAAAMAASHSAKTNGALPNKAPWARSLFRLDDHDDASDLSAIASASVPVSVAAESVPAIAPATTTSVAAVSHVPSFSAASASPFAASAAGSAVFQAKSGATPTKAEPVDEALLLQSLYSYPVVSPVQAHPPQTSTSFASPYYLYFPGQALGIPGSPVVAPASSAPASQGLTPPQAHQEQLKQQLLHEQLKKNQLLEQLRLHEQTSSVQAVAPGSVPLAGSVPRSSVAVGSPYRPAGSQPTVVAAGGPAIFVGPDPAGVSSHADTALGEWLQSIEFGAVQPVLAELGFSDLASLHYLRETDLEAKGVPPLYRRKFLAHLQRRLQSVPNPLEGLAPQLELAYSPAPSVAPPAAPVAPAAAGDMSVSTLLAQAGLDKYIEVFDRNEVDMGAFRVFTEKDFRDMGITAKGPLVKIMKLQDQLQQQSRSSASPDRPPEFVCGLTNEIMQDPVIAADGFSYERKSIEAWFATGNKTSPLTNNPMGSTLNPNLKLKSEIRDWQIKRKTR
eukprot:TRINITY_DN4273_c0_g1_i1.p1 TRINITY_DN4273_c0_g1~~TRINITY_DN4273_c0_g1_i1.p1  ORF type:complete len:1462 (-),score=497.96 TRINITY_DN4273_c0_g1_i1:123-4508(-)